MRGPIPTMITISEGKQAEVQVLDELNPEPGAFSVMDRGYVDYARLHVLHLAGSFFVTRAKSNLDAHRVYSSATDRSTGVICDQIIALDRLNPQVAARLARAFDRWRKYDAGRQEHSRAALESIRDAKGLSGNVGEVVGRALG